MPEFRRKRKKAEESISYYTEKLPIANKLSTAYGANDSVAISEAYAEVIQFEMDKGAGHETPLGKSDEQRQNLLKYYQYLAIHKIPEIFSNNLYPPVVNQLLRMIENNLIFILLLFFAGAFISFQLVSGKKRTDELQNLLPKNKLFLALQKSIALFLGSFTLCLLPIASIFIIFWGRNGLGNWNYPLKYFQQDKIGLYYAAGIILFYLLWIILFILLFISLGLLLTRFIKSFIFILVFSQSTVTFEHPDIANFLPSSYVFVENIYTHSPRVHLLTDKLVPLELRSTNDFRIDLFGARAEHVLELFTPNQALLLLISYCGVFIILTCLLIWRKRRI